MYLVSPVPVAVGVVDFVDEAAASGVCDDKHDAILDLPGVAPVLVGDCVSPPRAGVELFVP